MTSSAAHPTAAPTAPDRFPWLGLIVLSAAVFLSITAETMPMGLLPDMSADLGVDEAAIGLLVTVFAFTVVITSTPLVALTARIPRATMMIAIVLILAASNVLTAVGTDYIVIIGARVLGGLGHGLFWSLVAAYASRLVPEHLIARAVSITLTGGTLAFVLGVPLATALGHAIGWRWAFAAVAAAQVLAALAIWRFLPRVEAPVAPARVPGAAAVRDPGTPAVLLLCLTVALVMVGHYAFYTYIAPYLTTVAGIPADAVSAALFVFGLAGLLGLILSGTVLARRPSLGLLSVMAVNGLALLVLAVLAENFWVALVAFVLWGIAFGAIPPMLQTRLLRAAAPERRDIASAFYTTAFNTGIGGGALLGGIVMRGSDLGGLPLFDLALLAVGMVVVLIAVKRTSARPA